MSDAPLRVLVVDDTVTYRRIISDLLQALPGIEVVGSAPNGKIALQKVEQLRPDILTLDLEMPEMDGLEVLRQIKSRRLKVGAIMLSAFTTQGAESTVTALGLGAFDFVVKPTGGNVNESSQKLQRELKLKLNAFARTHSVQSLLTRRSEEPPPRLPAVKPAPPATNPVAQRMQQVGRRQVHPEVVGIGISTGGPAALARMLPALPGDLPVPVLLVQHMPPKFTKSLADDLDQRCALKVVEAADGQRAHPGEVLIAPGGCQMKIERQAGRIVTRVTDDPPENHCQPAVDYLFRSIAHVCGGHALGVVMTGMGSDGTLGCRLLKRQGALIMAQDQATCVVFGMPKILVEEGIAEIVAPLEEIAPQITRVVGQGVAACK